MQSLKNIEMSATVEDLYVIWEQNGSYCNNCPFDGEKKIKHYFGINEEDFVNICPLDASLYEWKQDESKNVPQWIVDNWDRVESHHKEMKKRFG